MAIYLPWAFLLCGGIARGMLSRMRGKIEFEKARGTAREECAGFIMRADCTRGMRGDLLGERFCDEGEGFRIGDADAKRCSRRERTLKRNGAVRHVAGNCRAAAVAWLLGDY